MPKFEWELDEMEDLGDLVGECEYCGNPLRYIFYISHKNWGNMEVGTSCCDNLTDSLLATNKIESHKRFLSRKNNFVKSPKWRTVSNLTFKRHALVEIQIEKTENGFVLTINNLTNKTKKYESLIDAKSKAFEVIESGELLEYCEKHKIYYPKK